MKFTVNKSEILGVLGNIQGLTGRKSNLAITSTVLIQATADGIVLNATDLETAFEGSYKARIESEGAIAINSRKFFEIVRDFPTEEILVNEVENHWIEIGHDAVSYHIVGMNPDDFPQFPRVEETRLIDMDAGQLKKMIEKTSFIIGVSDDKRAHILGCFLEAVEADQHNLLRLVSTDGGRLSKMDYIYGKNVELPLEKGVLVPKKGLHEVGKFLKSEGIVRVGIKSNKFILLKDNETLIIRLLEGEFPAYQDIIVKDEQYDILMNRQKFLMMLKRMSILATESYRAVMFHFDGGKLEINSTNPELGESTEDMPIDFKGQPLQLAFNPRFFIEALNVIDDEQVIVNVCDEQKPCLVEGVEEKNFLSAIMPMRV